MPEDFYIFKGYATTGYFQYVDAGTGQALVAVPGETYRIRAVEPGMAVPPDGNWELVAAKPAPAVKPAAQAEQPVQDAPPAKSSSTPASSESPEGGE